MLPRLLFLAFFLFALFPLQNARAQWTQIGEAMPDSNHSMRLAVGPDETIYAGFSVRDPLFLSSYYYRVFRFDGKGWEELPLPPTSNSINGRPIFSLAIDRHGILHLATDTQAMFNRNGYHPWVMKFDGSGWTTIGNSSRFTRPDADGELDALTFDDQNRPCYGYANNSQATVIRYTGTDWEPIAGGLRYCDMISDKAGDLYYAAFGDPIQIWKYSGIGSAWDTIPQSGLDSFKNFALLSAPANGRIYVGYVNGGYGGKPVAIYELNTAGTGWKRLGRTFDSRSFFTRIMSIPDGALYMFYQDFGEKAFNVVRYDGSDWRLMASKSGDVFNMAQSYGTSIYVPVIDSIDRRMVRIMKYDTRNDALAVPTTPVSAHVFIAPNPASKSLEIRNTNPAWNGSSAIIADLQGRIVKQVHLEPKLRVETASWPAGIYQLRLPDGQSMKIVKE